MKKLLQCIGFCVGFVALALVAALVVIHLTPPSNPHNYKTVGDIPAPPTYYRLDVDGFGKYLRSLPLKGRGSKIKLYSTGTPATIQAVNYAVIDVPLLSNAEQCADVCMRLRAEYLYQAGMPIAFHDVNNNVLKYEGNSRKEFEKYLRSLYKVASTYSLNRWMPQRQIQDMQPGDVFVYPAKHGKLGHAMMVIDVAENTSGEKVYMLAEGSTPARSIHIVYNLKNGWKTPWFTLDETADRIFASVCFYKKGQLKYFK